VVDLRGSRDTERKIVTHLGMQYVAMPWRCSFQKIKRSRNSLHCLETIQARRFSSIAVWVTTARE